MRACFCAAFLLSLACPLREIAKPVAIAEDDLFISFNGDDRSPFSAVDDGTSAGTGGNDMNRLTAGTDSYLLGSNDGDSSSCSSELSFGDNVDDGMLATC